MIFLILNHKLLKTGLLLIFVFWSSALTAQVPIDLDAMKSRFPNEKLIILNNEQHMNISTSKKGLEITNNYVSQTLYLTDRAQEYSSESISYSSTWEEITDVEAKTLIPAGKKYKALEVDDFSVSKPVSDGLFYDDYEQLSFHYRGLQEGAISSLSYNEKIKDPHFLGGFHFRTYAPTEKSVLTATFPSSVKLKYIFRGSQDGITFTETVKGGMTTYRWEAENMAKIPYEADAPNIRYYAPHILLYV
ncbi:MAG: DUF3857 domain-containing protein, partial [Bacteroidota bacterium]|nr:DUF3857 domain-containing protein [Bacteroidota bacterium]